jgi:hypothetical protein
VIATTTATFRNSPLRSFDPAKLIYARFNRPTMLAGPLAQACVNKSAHRWIGHVRPLPPSCDSGLTCIKVLGYVLLLQIEQNDAAC